MPIEVAFGVGPLAIRELAHVLRLAVSQTIGAGARVVVLPLGSLSSGPKINHLSHRFSQR